MFLSAAMSAFKLDKPESSDESDHQNVFVSVVMAAYNAERYLADAIESVLAQTHSNFELIIVNDGSTDSTAAILDGYESCDSRIGVVTQNNRGAAVARNRGIETANSDYVAIIDSDDIMEPHRLERQLSFMQSIPDLCVTSCLAIHIDEDGNELSRSRPELLSDDEVSRTRDRKVLIGFHNPGVMMKRSVALQFGGYRQQFWPAEDLDLWNRIADEGLRILVQPEYLLRYRIHGTQSAVALNSLYLKQVRWIEECSRMRRLGLQEPTYEDFIKLWRQKPILARLNRERKDRAYSLYKRATYSYGSNRMAVAAFQIIASAALNPLHGPRQVVRKLLLPKLSRVFHKLSFGSR